MGFPLYVTCHFSLAAFNIFFSVCFYSLSVEKAMENHSTTLAWKIPWPEEPGRLQSRGSHRVGHEWATNTLLNCADSSAPGCMQKHMHITEFKMLAVVGLVQKCCCSLQSGAGAWTSRRYLSGENSTPSPLQNSTKQPRPRSIVPGELFSTARLHSFPFCNQRVKPSVLLNRIWSLGSKQHQAGGPFLGTS